MMRPLVMACLVMIWVAPAGGAPPAATSEYQRPAETKDRLSNDEMEEMVRQPVSLVRRGQLSAGVRLFESMLNDLKRAHPTGHVEVADLLTAFGVGLYMETRSSDDAAVGRASLKYMADAIGAYKQVFGPVHPEVALAINSYADVLQQLAPKDTVPPEVIPLLEDALKIRLATLGSDHSESRSNMTRIANLKARTAAGNAETIAEAESLYRQALTGAPTDSGADKVTGAIPIRLKLARLLAENGRAGEAVAEVQQAIKDSEQWAEEDRCFGLFPDVIEIGAALEERGESEGALRLAILINQSGCFEEFNPSNQAVG